MKRFLLRGDLEILSKNNYYGEGMQIVSENSVEAKPDDYYNRLIGEHFPFIEKRCWQVVHSRLNPSSGQTLKIENEVLELCNRVLDKLKQKNFHILRQFQGNAKLTTYLTAIIANQSVDLIRKYKGRDRQKERAKKLGDLGQLIYRLALEDQLSIEKIYNKVGESVPSNYSLAEIETMVETIKGKRYSGNPQPAPTGAVKEGVGSNGEGRPIVVDDKNNPEDSLLASNGHTKVKKIVEALLDGLSGEERMILRLRFPEDEGETPHSIVQVADILGLSTKATYKKLSRLLKRCKDHLEKEGVRLHDFV